MREFFWACLALVATSTGLRAAETVAYPFKLEFYTSESALSVAAELKQSCRYEKIVWSDSAEFETKWQETPLEVKKTKLAHGRTRVSVSLESEVRMEIGGIFRPSKGCYSNVEIIVSDTRYAIGWAGNRKKAISFELATKDFYKEQSTLDLTKLENLLSDRELDFHYRAVGGNQVNVFLYIDGERTWEVFPTTALKNPVTNRPYPLEKP